MIAITTKSSIKVKAGRQKAISSESHGNQSPAMYSSGYRRKKLVRAESAEHTCPKSTLTSLMYHVARSSAARSGGLVIAPLVPQACRLGTAVFILAFWFQLELEIVFARVSVTSPSDPRSLHPRILRERKSCFRFPVCPWQELLGSTSGEPGTRPSGKPSPLGTLEYEIAVLSIGAGDV